MKKSKRGYPFYGCSNYPDCTFMTWYQPTTETCPKCGKSLFKRRGGLIVCLNEGCGYERKVERKKKGAAEAEDKAETES